MPQNNKIIGFALTIFSVVLLIILIFVKISLDSQSAELCDIFSQNNLDMAQCPAHKNNTSWLVVTAFGIAFLLFGIGIYLIFSSKIAPLAEAKRDFKEIDLSSLDEEEKKIYDSVKSKGGTAFQGDLVRESDFGKVKVSRILDRLETKDIVERKRRGMTNLIVIK